MSEKSSKLPRFRELDVCDRRRALAALLEAPESEIARDLEGGIETETANRMVENAVGVLAVPFGVALNVVVNGVEYVVPMATEEPSVIAAVSHAAKRVRAGGGFVAEADASLMAAQIQLSCVPDPVAGIARLLDKRAEILARANEVVPGLVQRGGGARELEARDLGDGFVVAHVVVDCCDAMGANLLNTIAEAVGREIAALVGGALGLRILSNYCDRRCVRVRASIPIEALGSHGIGGLDAARGIALASRFAEKDSYRAVTHNKGIMNGVDAVVLATGNDFRAVEAAAHAFAARSGVYRPLATWRLAPNDDALVGELEVPLALGIVGGALRAHRGARLALRLLGVRTSRDLAMVTAAVGLASNLSALRALATEGIQRGHMALHHRA
jgi:hydroxymethylglutaryl-CoA reductase